MPNKNKYSIYLRKSRADVEAEAHGEGETLERHEKALLELASKQKLSVAKIYREVVSGETIASRPMMQQLLSEVEQNMWAGVLVMEIERLARGDTMDQGFVSQAFKYSDTLIITPMKTYDPTNEFDEEYFEFGLFMSRREYKTINRRLQRGRIASVKEGKYVASRPPYGYTRKRLENDKGFTLEVHPEQAEVVRLIFELYTKGEKQKDGTYKRIGASLITRRLNELKIKPQRSNKWVAASVRDILINPVYIGKIRWNWRPASKKIVNGEVNYQRPRSDEYIVSDGLHQGIIDEAIFDKAQEYMKSSPPSPMGKRHIVKNPLAGLVKCGKCGRTMVRRPHNPNKNKPDTLMCPVPHCDNISSALSFVEDKILNSLSYWLQDYKIEWNSFYDSQDSSSDNSFITVKRMALRKCDKEIKTLEKQRSKLHDLLEQGLYDTETFLSRNSELSGRLKNVMENKVAIERVLTSAECKEQSRQDIIPEVERILEIYDTLKTAKDKNDLLKEVLETVVYTKSINSRWHNSSDDFTLVIYPKLPKQG